MTLTKLGKYIERIERRNVNSEYGIEAARGISNNKELMTSKADLLGRSFDKFHIVYPEEFVFNRRTTRMGEKIGLGFNNTDQTYIFTEDYVHFGIKENSKQVLLPYYLYIFFNRPEFDRYVRYNSWGSSTEFFSWEEMCDVDIDLPPIEIQQKYVNLYNAMLDNQKNYENGLEDLKLAVNMFYDGIKNNNLKRIGDLIRIKQNKNTDYSIPFSQLRGINEFGEFIPTRDSISENDIDKYLIADVGTYAVNFMCLGNFGKFYLAYNDFNEKYLVSPACNLFEITYSNLNPYYFLFVMQRSEFQRKCVFYGDGNTRGGININDFSNITIPIPTNKEQLIISNLYKSYENRRKLNENLKKQIKNLCPILIKGSIEEARKGV